MTPPLFIIYNKKKSLMKSKGSVNDRLCKGSKVDSTVMVIHNCCYSKWIKWRPKNFKWILCISFDSPYSVNQTKAAGAWSWSLTSI